MKKSILSLLLITIIFFSCATSKKSNSDLTSVQTISTSKKVEDGLTFETAVIINETSEEKGVRAEYVWIKKHYSDYTVSGQKLTSHSKNPYDIITIVLADKTEVNLYFNISKFFGKF